MVNVIALWVDCEIGYGEGESLFYASEDCFNSIDKAYLKNEVVLNDIVFEWFDESIKSNRTMPYKQFIVHFIEP